MWTLLVAFVVLAFAVFLYKVGVEIFEDSSQFFMSVGIFFILFIAAAAVISLFGPKPEGTADVMALFSAFINGGVRGS